MWCLFQAFCLTSHDLRNTMCVCLNDWLAYTAVLRVKGQTAPSYVTTKQRWIATEADTGSNKADLKEPLPHRVLAGGFEVRITGVLPVFPAFQSLTRVGAPYRTEEMDTSGRAEGPQHQTWEILREMGSCKRDRHSDSIWARTFGLSVTWQATLLPMTDLQISG